TKIEANGSTLQGRTIIDNQSIDKTYTDKWNVTNNDSVVYDSIHTLCWHDHRARISSELSVSYNGVEYNYQGDQDFNYTGTDIKDKTFKMNFQ
ncbi:MAG: hypothetical protein ACRC3K_14020, partial [Plesiomonas sp.]